MPIEDLLHPLLGRYLRSEGWPRTLAGLAYRQLPARVRHGPRYARFAAVAARGFDADVDAVAARLSETLSEAVRHVPAYAGFRSVLDARGRAVFEALRTLPLTSKIDIKREPHAYLSRRMPATRRVAMFTGGSTAHPMAFYLERGVTRPRETAYIETIDRTLLGARPGDWTLSLRGRSVAAAASGKRLWSKEPIKRHLLVSSDHLERQYMPGYAELLARHRPRLIHAFPSALYPLARWLEAHPLPVFTSGLRGVLLTSENVYGFQRALFERVFACPVIDHYGHSERVLMAVTLPGDGRHHFFPLYGYPELVDADGRPIDTPGVLGEIVGTSFDNAAMPFVRYRTGDMGIWDEAPAPTERARKVMRRIEGRLQEFVVCRDARLVSITTLGAAHFAELAHVDTIQFEQHEPGVVVLRVVAPTPLTDAQRAAIAQAVRDKTQGGCTVRVEAVDRIERTARGKHRMLIQHLDLGRYFGAAPEPAEHERAMSQPA